MKNLAFSLLLFIIGLLPHLIWAQGYMVIVGGGPESNKAGSWSDAPYRWAVDKSRNKRVAIISTVADVNSISTFMVDYFRSLGAVEAKEFSIRTPNAQTYNELMSYDVFFFRGGDQFDYYSRWKGTTLERAARDKFMQGGVLMGTSAGCAILSSVVYTAEGTTMQSYHIIENVNHSSITLRDDFINVFPGYYFDTHFMERGRMPRLVGFLANWMQTQGKYPLRGIGVDDMMALCIDFKEKKAYAYGTATVSVYTPSTFSTTSGRLSAGTILVQQLVNGDTLDFTNLSVKGNPANKRNVVPPILEETISYQLYLTGSNEVNENAALFDSLAQSTLSGNLTDTVLILSSDTSATSVAAQVRTQLITRNLTNVLLGRTILSSAADTSALLNRARVSKKYIFVNNNSTNLQAFFNSIVGDSVKKLMTMSHKIVAFVGEDAHYVGKKSVPANFYTSTTLAYDGNLASINGLGLLKTSAIVSRAFSNTASGTGSYQFWENNQAAIPLLIGWDSLRFGWYLPTNSFLRIYPNQGQTICQAFGRSVFLYINDGGKVEKISQKKENQTPQPRSGLGFENMKMMVLNTQSISLNPFQPSLLMPCAYFAVLDTANLRVGDTLKLWNASHHATSYTWTINGRTYSDFTPVVRVDSAKVYSVALTARNANGENTYAINVVVKPRITSGLLKVNENPTIAIYPNPSQGEVFIEWDFTPFFAELLSIDGKSIGKYTSTQEGKLIILRDLKPSVYLLKISNSIGETYLSKIVVF
ncbi:MAG: Type 1 glutamine amidotransferase-like domain-containing protein [Cytophagales bacterium]|nr:Type 1 glutamine amidotransferase-like domain-containing protein [Cytophagales bacterium]MDW8383994.1 Type 1 glutamine amidotransferase-like domain-containing protein [Flammeovirgaceae bacterium]